MASLLSAKVAAITGGVTGIGRAIALAYVRQGASVAVNHLDGESSKRQFESMREELGELAEKLISVPGDITKPETAKNLVEAAVAAFGRLDVFVSNAGICQFAEFLT
jgi:L-rhamnose 1-dehydrogenase